MKADEILKVLEGLAQSQGFYGRLLHTWIEYEMLDEALALLEEQNFENALDLVLFIETA